jgi:hypothetical protein
MTIANIGAALRSAAGPKILRKAGLPLATVLAAALMPTIASAQDYADVESNGNLHLRGYGTFFMPGTPKQIDSATANGGGSFFITLPGGSIMTNQMHVQFMLPEKQSKRRYPIAIVHGCCLSSKSWQTTPDGRMGWDEYFVRNGFDTYLMDQVGRARSGFDPSKFNAARAGLVDVTEQAPIQIATDQFAWNVFRWGTTPCTQSPCSETTTPNPGIKFPMDTVGVGPDSNLQFYNMVIPDMFQTLSGNPTPPDAAGFYNTPSQMAKLADELDGVVLVGHSQSSSFPTRAALQPDSGCYPWTGADACKVKGIIQLETGCFDNLTDAQINTLKHIPILVVVGDFYTVPQPPASCVTMMNQINGAGGDMKFASLPDLRRGDLYPGSPGPLPGVEHMMMIGTKNIEVANLLIGWMDHHVKVPRNPPHWWDWRHWPSKYWSWRGKKQHHHGW